MEAKKGEMYCAIVDDETGKVCGRVDESHSAQCIKHGRSVHKIKGEDSSSDIPYPAGHNWEGLTPRQVNEGYARQAKKTQKLKCEYPGCKKDSVHNHTLKLINEEDSAVNLSFCEYHFFIVMGGHFEARINREAQNLLGEKKEISFELLGPLHEVEIAEQVMGAREMIAKLQSDDKGLNK